MKQLALIFLIACTPAAFAGLNEQTDLEILAPSLRPHEMVPERLSVWECTEKT